MKWIKIPIVIILVIFPYLYNINFNIKALIFAILNIHQLKIF